MEWDAEKIKQMRKTKRISQSELSQILGCRQQTVSEWECGLYSPSNAYTKLLNMLLLSPDSEGLRSETIGGDSSSASLTNHRKEDSFEADLD